jgi:hypothetical protein
MSGEFLTPGNMMLTALLHSSWSFKTRMNNISGRSLSWSYRVFKDYREDMKARMVKDGHQRKARRVIRGIHLLNRAHKFTSHHP